MHPKTLQTLEFDKIIAQLAQLAASAPGRRRCLGLLPAVEIEEVTERLAQTSDAQHILLTKGSPPLYGLHDIAASVTRAELDAALNCAELLQIASFLGAAARLKRFVPENAAGENRLFSLMEALQPLTQVANRLTQSIISDEELADSASPKLASLRSRMRQVQNGIKDTLDTILRNQSKALQENLITQRSGRYVVPVRADSRGQVPGVVHDASGSGATLFIEPMAVVQANNKLRELAAQEREEIERILYELSGLVACEATVLRQNAAIVEELDFAFAKGRLSLQMKAVAPDLNTEGRVHLKQARHPLIPAEQVVAIDLYVGGSFRSLIVTGPNTGGKTVALKNLGLLTLMAQAGLHIPAREHSELAVFKQVLADIGDEQSIEQNLSTFSAHMKQIVRITEAVDDKSLVLLDELGSGTDPTEGAALAVAILEFMREKQAVTLATTHYKELKAYALQTDGVENACCEFDTETLRPTYRLLIGVPGVSNAFIISRKLGLDPAIIEAAQGQISQSSLQFEDLIKEIERNKTAALREREAAEKERRLLREETTAVEEQKRSFADKKEGVLAQLRERSREELSDELEIIDAYLEDLRELVAAGDPAEALKRGQALRHAVKRRHGEVEDEIGRATLNQGRSSLRAEDIEADQDYYAPALNMIARALGKADNKGQVSIQSGVIKIQVKASSLLPVSAAPQSLRKEKNLKSGVGRSQRVISSKRQNFSPEIKLLGQTADEARSNLDRFLDDAVLAGSPSVRIVHGKGTGVLRKAVTELLKRDKRVKSSRMAGYGEGDSGVTIAELR